MAYEPRIGNLGRLLDLVTYQQTFPGTPGYDSAQRVLAAFQRHVSLSEEEIRALPWIAMSFALFYRVFHVLLYIAEVEDGPEAARYLVTKEEEEIAMLSRQEGDVEKLSEMLLRA